jgi:secreted trypsin-like serine protease
VIFVLLHIFLFASRGPASDIQVMVGNKNLIQNSPSQFIDVLDIRIHEEYDPESRKNDIALLKV